MVVYQNVVDPVIHKTSLTEAAVATPVGAADYGWFLDASDGNIKKALLDDMPGGGGGEPSDGDKGDITVSSSGTVWNIDANAVGTTEIANSAVTLAKIANISTSRVLGRTTGGSGVVEELTVSAGLTMTAGTVGIQDAGVTTAKIADGNVTAAKLNADVLAAMAALFQGLDATLTALAGVTTAANKLIYATGSDTFATTDFPSFARTLVANTTAADARTDLELTSIATTADGTIVGTLLEWDGSEWNKLVPPEDSIPSYLRNDGGGTSSYWDPI